MIRTALFACVALALSACTASVAEVSGGPVPRDAYGKPVLIEPR